MVELDEKALEAAEVAFNWTNVDLSWRLKDAIRAYLEAIQQDQAKEDAWSDFENANLTDGEGHSPSATYKACRVEFDRGWQISGTAGAFESAKAEHTRLHPPKYEPDYITALQTQLSAANAEVERLREVAERIAQESGDKAARGFRSQAEAEYNRAGREMLTSLNTKGGE